MAREYYHIFNRGNSRQKIFLDDHDRKRFIKCLFLCNSCKGFKFRDHIVDKKIEAWDFDRGETLVSIGAWTLMPNHFHLYLTFSPKSDLGEAKSRNNISEFMQKLMTAYTKYFNARHGRTGALYEGKFKSVRVKNDKHAKYLFSYIHLNPIKLIDSIEQENDTQNTKLVLEYLNSYKWSSYNDHRKIERPENKILQLEDFPKYFSTVKDFNSEIFSWLEHAPQVRLVDKLCTDEL